MTRRDPRRCASVGLALLGIAIGCAESNSRAEPTPDPTNLGAAPSVERGSSAGDAPSVAPDQASSEPRPAPALEPEPPRLPDGTPIAACGEPPPGMACIPGGPFVRGSDDGPEHARPSETVWLQTFYMDLYEVTYAEYEACEAEKKCPRAGPRYTDFDHPKMPIQGVSWFDAVAYCEAHGKRLPTEAQWEKAARGPDGHLYPWGDEPSTCERAIIKDATGRSCGLKKAISKPETGRPWDVGSRPPGVYGLYDMMGNSWEWVADWWSRSYADCGEPCRGVDPRGPCDGAPVCPGHRMKIVRGGSWYWDASRATGVYRRPHVPNNDPFHHFGFRCAATVEDAEALRGSL